MSEVSMHRTPCTDEPLALTRRCIDAPRSMLEYSVDHIAGLRLEAFQPSARRGRPALGHQVRCRPVYLGRARLGASSATDCRLADHPVTDPVIPVTITNFHRARGGSTAAWLWELQGWRR